MGATPQVAANRAGSYVRQAAGYRAFIPNPLPPNPPINLTAEMQRCCPTPIARLELIEKLWDSLAQADLPVAEAERKFLDQRVADMAANPDEQSSWQVARAGLIKQNP